MTCTGASLTLGIPLPPFVFACANIGSGSGGGTNPRLMAGTPAGTLGYQLIPTARGWSCGAPGMAPPSGSSRRLPWCWIARATASTTVPIYARLPASANPGAAASYLSTFSTAQTRFDYGQLLTAVTCAPLLASLGGQTNPTFTVSATVNKNLRRQHRQHQLRLTGILSADRTANGRVGVRCTPQTDLHRVARQRPHRDRDRKRAR